MSKGTKRGNSVLIQTWLNKTDEHEAAALVVWEKLSKEFSARQIITDALLCASGHTPDMFGNAGRNAPIIGQIRQALREEFENNRAELLAQFGQEVVKMIRQNGLALVEDEPDAPQAKVSPFMQNFARGFIERQNQVMGSDDE